MWVHPWPHSAGWGSGVAMSCGVGLKLVSDSALLWLWLWSRPAAVAPIQPLAWELPYSSGAAIKSIAPSYIITFPITSAIILISPTAFTILGVSHLARP